MNGGRFKPGENGHTKTVPDDLRQAKRLNKQEIERIFNQYLYAPAGDLVAAAKDPMKPTIEVLVISILLSAIRKGDHDKLNFVLERLLGKVKDNVDVTIRKSFHEQCVDFIESVEAKFERID